jgi:hypothetical protein
MTQMMTMHSPVAAAKPQANIYTVLLIVAIVAVIVAMVMGMATLMGDPSNGSGYGLTFDQVITGERTSTAEIMNSPAAPGRPAR